MREIPEPIRSILRDEGLSAACWKRLKDAWPEPPKAPKASDEVIAAAHADLLSARDELRKVEEKARVIEIRTLPEGCITLKDAERSMIASAIRDSRSWKETLAATRRIGISTSAFYRKLKLYGLSPLSTSYSMKRKIKRLQDENERLEKLLV